MKFKRNFYATNKINHKGKSNKFDFSFNLIAQQFNTKRIYVTYKALIFIKYSTSDINIR